MQCLHAVPVFRPRGVAGTYLLLGYRRERFVSAPRVIVQWHAFILLLALRLFPFCAPHSDYVCRRSARLKCVFFKSASLALLSIPLVLLMGRLVNRRAVRGLQQRLCRLSRAARPPRASLRVRAAAPHARQRRARQRYARALASKRTSHK